MDSIPTWNIFPETTRNFPPDQLATCTELGLTGDRAYREISSRLLGYPGAQQLLEEVHEFYGIYLSYIESSEFTSTLYAIHLQHDPIALESANIQLQLGTDRTVEALAHELLHLHLPMLGFPLGESVRVPLQLDHYAQSFLSMCNWVVNVVQHEINFQRFTGLGFDRRRFLARRVSPMDYERRLCSVFPDRDSWQVDFSRWCIEHVRHLLTARHGGNEDSLGYAQDALDWGSQLHPELKETAAAIHRWFEDRIFAEPDRYARQVNLLLDLMRIPEFTRWVTLKRSDYKKPVAVRLDSKRICSLVACIA